MALILHYFTKFVYDVVVKMFTFAISSPDEFFCMLPTQRLCMHMPAAIHSVFANSAGGRKGLVGSPVTLHTLHYITSVNAYRALTDIPSSLSH